MTNAEIDALCEWIDQNIGQYIGWDEWGSLRVVNPDRLKSVLKDIEDNAYRFYRFIEDYFGAPPKE